MIVIKESANKPATIEINDDNFYSIFNLARKIMEECFASRRKNGRLEFDDIGYGNGNIGFQLSYWPKGAKTPNQAFTDYFTFSIHFADAPSNTMEDVEFVLRSRIENEVDEFIAYVMR